MGQRHRPYPLLFLEDEQIGGLLMSASGHDAVAAGVHIEQDVIEHTVWCHAVCRGAVSWLAFIECVKAIAAWLQIIGERIICARCAHDENSMRLHIDGANAVVGVVGEVEVKLQD